MIVVVITRTLLKTNSHMLFLMFLKYESKWKYDFSDISLGVWNKKFIRKELINH